MQEDKIKHKKRTEAELLTDEEVARFLYLKKKHKVRNATIAHAVGIKNTARISGWKVKIPARCRSLLELWELKDKLQSSFK